MQKNVNESMFIILWGAFLFSIGVFFFLVTTLTGGFGQFEVLDHNRMLNFNDTFSVAFYSIGAIMYAGHSLAPKLARGPNAELPGFVIKMALLEALAVFGFVLGHMKQDAQASIPFFVLAAVGMLRASPLFKMQRPRKPGTPIT